MQLFKVDGKWHLQNILSFILKLTMLVGAGLCLLKEHYLLSIATLGIIGITFLPIILSRHFQVNIPPEFECLTIAFVYATLYLGSVQGFYLKYWWWDSMLHTGSGFILGILGFLLVYVLNERREIGLAMRPHFVALFAFTFSLALGALWEIFEFTVDSFFDMNMQETGLVDTMWDLIVDTVGALTISLAGWRYLANRGSNSFLERWINNFIDKNPRLFARNQ